MVEKIPIKTRRKKLAESRALKLLKHGPSKYAVVKCAACKQTITVGEYYTTITLGPGGNSENRRKYREGEPCALLCEIVHWACATGIEDI